MNSLYHNTQFLLNQMKEDFFAEGFGDNSGIKFSEQQQLFFKAKLQILDPQKKNHIDLGQAIGFLKYSRLPNQKVKRIFDNLKLTNKRTLDYTEMKKIFRAVSLVQNKIEPSSINIDANIKTPLPKFDDEQSSQQQVKQQNKPEPQKVVEKNPNLPVSLKNNQGSSFDGFNAFNQAFDAKANQNTTIQNVSIQKETPKVAPKSSGQQNKVENALTKNMKKFEDYWSKLPTIDGMKIKGDQVKRLFGNSQNKKQLYKLWKLCSHSYKDCLSKGELYIFISLMNSKSSLIPSKLSPEMQFAIQKLDGANKMKQKNKQSAQNLRISNTSNAFEGFDIQKSQQFDKSQGLPAQKKTNKNRLSGSHDFDDFANFANPTPKFQNIPEERRIKSPETKQFSHAQRKLQIPPPPPLQVQPPSQIHYLPKQVVQSIYQASAKHYLAIVNQFIPPLQILSTQNKQYKSQLQNINLNLNNTDQALMNTYSKLHEVKTSQDELNNRLTSTCIRMQKIIQKQSELINYLMEMMKSQLTMNNEKVAALTLDAQNMEEQVNEKVRSVQHIVQNRFKINEHTGRNSIQTIPQNHSQQQQNSMVSTNYNKKSAQYMVRSKQSIGFKKKQETGISNQTQTQPPYRQQEQGTALNKIQEGQLTESVPPNMFPQKLRQKLLEQQRLHQNDPNFKMQQSQSQMDENRQNNDDYHWEIGNGHQFNANQMKRQKFKKTDSQSENQEQQSKKQKIKQELIKKQQYQLEQKKKYLEEQEKNRILQAQQQAQLQAQQQAQLQAQQQAQLQAQQAQLQSQMYNQLQAQQAQQPLDEEGQKIRMKQARLILIINFLNPMSKQDHLQVALRVSLMNQMQLDTAYAQMYNIYLQRIQAQKKEAMKNGQNPIIVDMPTQEQFRTNKISINQ